METLLWVRWLATRKEVEHIMVRYYKHIL